MRALRRRRWLLLPLVAAGVLLGRAALVRHWAAEAEREQAYGAMEEGFHPAWRDLRDGRVYSGQPVDEAIQLTGPPKVDYLGRFTRLSYESGGYRSLTVFAKDGRVYGAQAGSCIWHHTFFGSLTQADAEELSAAEESLRSAKLGK